MFGRCAYLLVGCLLVSTSVEAQPLEPVAQWVLDYRDDQCLAYREYGAPAAPMTLGIRPAPDGQTYELLISRSRAGSAFATELKGSVDLGRGPLGAWVLNYGSTQGKTNIYQYRISASEMEQARSAPSVTFHAAGAPDIIFRLNTMPDLLAGLKTCTADLLDYWNSDGETNGRIATPTKGDVRAVFTADDYPGQAVENWQEGTSQFFLMVNETGAVAGCFVTKPSGVPVLDAVGCQVIRKRTKFQPALDRTGKPVRSTVVTPPVSWRLEG